MDLGLQGKVALVTASSRGLGLAVAESLAAEGAAVVICGRDATALAQARSHIDQGSGHSCVAIQSDVSSAVDRRRLLDAVLSRYGRIDIAVLNTGGPPPGSIESIALTQWEQAYRLLLESAVDISRGVLPGMKERRWGRLICIGSMFAKQPADNMVLSNSLRLALVGFTRTVANEYGAFGITANAVLPGYTMTDRMRHVVQQQAKAADASEEQVLAAIESQIPLRRFGRPQEFASAVTFLASDRASYITGTAMLVDGGFVRAVL